jgi:hypothetical protein
MEGLCALDSELHASHLDDAPCRTHRLYMRTFVFDVSRCAVSDLQVLLRHHCKLCPQSMAFPPLARSRAGRIARRHGMSANSIRLR